MTQLGSCFACVSARPSSRLLAPIKGRALAVQTPTADCICLCGLCCIVAAGLGMRCS